MIGCLVACALLLENSCTKDSKLHYGHRKRLDALLIGTNSLVNRWKARKLISWDTSEYSSWPQMLPFVGNEKQDISQQSPVSLITKLPSFKYCGACSAHGIDDNSWKSFVGQAKGEEKFGRLMRTWEIKY